MEKPCLDDNCYNITKQLIKKLEFLSHAKDYVNDAKKCSTSGEDVWKKIIEDEEKHTEMLYNLLSTEMRKHNPDPY